jgi:hypothetical protein
MLGRAQQGTGFASSLSRDRPTAFTAAVAAALAVWLALPAKATEVSENLIEHRNSIYPHLKLARKTASNPHPLRPSGRLTQYGKTLLTADFSIPKTGPIAIDARINGPASSLFSLAAPLLPATARQWQPHSGNLKGRVKLRWQPNSWRVRADIEASALAVTVGRLQINDTELELRLWDWPDGEAELNAEIPSLQLASGLRASHLTIRTSYRRDVLTLKQARSSILGGTLEIVPTTLDLRRQPSAVILRVQAIDLARLLQSLHQEGLSGTGTVSGELPLSIASDIFEVHDGQLATTTSGVLRYTGPAAATDNIAFKALSDLAYDSLKATLNYRRDGDYRLSLRLQGKNPALLEGHPLALKLNITGHLPELLRAAIVSGDFSHPILEQVKAKPAEDAGGPAPKLESSE